MTIGSQAEQSFIEDWARNNNISNVALWIGLEWNNNTFKWMDGTNVHYENYQENITTPDVNKCIKMELGDAAFGKWSDDRCSKKYLIGCQKKQVNRELLQHQINNLTKIVESSRSGVIPIGFIYTQLPNQSSPSLLWPNMEWTEMTQSYAGLFFRAEGGNSSSFGSLQNASSPHLTTVNAYTDRINVKNHLNLEQGIESRKIYTGCHSNEVGFSLSFKLSNEEVRPINKAIKIWKRTG